MNAKNILVSLTALIAVFLVLQTVSAYELVDSATVTVDINGVQFVPTDYSSDIALLAGETIPIKVNFRALENASDVKVKAWISGYRSEVSDSTERFDIIENNIYSKRLSLKLPSDIDETDAVTLIVRIETKNKADEFDYNLELQRESYELDVLSVEADKQVVAGSTLGVSLVLKNMGMHEAEDTFAIVRIPALDVEKKIYFGDLTPEDEGNGCCKEDAVERKLSLAIPSEAQEGTYKLEVEAYNADTTTTISRDVMVIKSEEASRVLSGIKSRSVAANEEAVFDLIVVNPSNKLKVYTIVADENPNILVTIDQPTLTVPADSSSTVKVRATGFEKGTYTFSVNVNSDAKLVDTVSLSVNVAKKAVESSVVILTIVLAIVFIVLLIVLIVLLTRKPVRSEESEESYY